MLNSQPETLFSNKLLYSITAITGILIAVVVVGHILTPLGGGVNPSTACYSIADPFHATLFNILTPLSVLLTIFLTVTFLFRQFNKLYERILVLAIVGIVGLFVMVLVFASSAKGFFGYGVYAKDKAGIAYCAELQNLDGTKFLTDLNVYKCENLKCELVKTIEKVGVGRFQFIEASDGSLTLVDGNKVMYP